MCEYKGDCIIFVYCEICYGGEVFVLDWCRCVECCYIGLGYGLQYVIGCVVWVFGSCICEFGYVVYLWYGCVVIEVQCEVYVYVYSVG